MNNFDLDTPLLNFLTPEGKTPWTVRHAMESTAIFGALGTGKSSSSGRMIAIRLLEANFGGLVITVKPDEKDNWVEYARLTGREDNICILEPNGYHQFNFLKYLGNQNQGSSGLTGNIVDVLETVITANQAGKGKINDEFWASATHMLLYNVIDLCKLAYGEVTLETVYNIAQTLPQEGQSINIHGDDLNAFETAYKIARDKAVGMVGRFESNYSDAEIDQFIKSGTYDKLLSISYPETRLFKQIDQFFVETLRNLAGKTRSIVDFSVTGFLFDLLKEPIFSLFCDGDCTVTPEMCTEGKVIILNLPIKEYNKVGRSCQIMFKYIWQLAMERRKIQDDTIPVFLFADEYQNVLHEKDNEYSATARSSRIISVYIAQNLPSYQANMIGDKSDKRVASFMGTIGTKIWHANTCVETNRWASEIIGDAYHVEHSESATMSGKFSQSNSKSYRLSKVIRPETFIQLKTGSKINNYQVEAIVHRQGMPINGMDNHVIVTFDQRWQPEFSRKSATENN